MSYSYKIKLNEIDDLKCYINKAVRIDGDILIGHGKYWVNGKSLMGIFSLDLEDELNIEFSNLSENDLKIVDSLSLIH